MQGKAALSAEDIREIAHELRAPLGGLSAMIELIARTPLDAEQVRFVSALGASARHLNELCDRVLSPESNPPAVCVPLGPLLESIALSAAARAARRGLAFRLEAAPGLELRPIAAPGPFRQVVENLIDNAVRLTEAGTVTLALFAQSESRVGVRVCDEGPGISEAEAERLIREGGGIEGRAGGAGLGLSIAGRLVAERGGQLGGGPALADRGAAFAFDWPAERAGATLSAAADCLIVDDHPASRQVLAAILGALGLSADAAGGVDEAIRLHGQGGHKLVLTDLCMPEGGGERLIRHFAGLAADHRPHVLVISADPLPADSPLAGDIAGTIAKPVSVQAIASALARCGFAPASAARAA